jgi:hypothetical protein
VDRTQSIVISVKQGRIMERLLRQGGRVDPNPLLLAKRLQLIPTAQLFTRFFIQTDIVHLETERHHATVWFINQGWGQDRGSGFGPSVSSSSCFLTFAEFDYLRSVL